MKGNRMKTANLVVVLDKENKSVLLCKRRKIKACLILWEESWNRMKTVQPPHTGN